MTPPVRYIDCDALVDLLRTSGGQVAVIDVRDEDWVGGHVAGAVNWPSSNFEHNDSIDELIATVLQGKDKAVVHCMFSQQRGPRSALKLAQRLEEVNRQNVAVLVLRGGFQRFRAMYGSDASLFADVVRC